MIAEVFLPRQLFRIDTTEIIMKGETGTNYFKISVDNYNSYKVNT